MIAKCTCEDGPFFATWQQAVSDYTQRQLTEPADKLPAFSGLAEAFSRLRNDQYLAGLWRRRLVHDLMWSTRPPGVSRFGPKTNTRHNWRAPSWSWACLDAGIQTIGAHKRIIGDAPWRLVGQTETAQVEYCKVSLEDERNPFGPVKGGHVILKGPLIKARLVKGVYFWSLRVDGIRSQLAFESGAKLTQPEDFASPELDLIFLQNPDIEGHGDPKDGIDVWCLQMREEAVQPKNKLPGRSQVEQITLLDGLLLFPVNADSNLFRRIGVWVTDWRVVVEPEQHPFLNSKLETVTIV